MITAHDFIKEYEDKIGMVIVFTNVIDKDWKYFHWEICLSFEDRSISVNYYGGKNAGEPKLEDVLCSLSSDSGFIREYDLEEFLIELDFCNSAEQLKRGFKAYKDSQTNDKKLRHLFGDKYEEFTTIVED